VDASRYRIAHIVRRALQVGRSPPLVARKKGSGIGADGMRPAMRSLRPAVPPIPEQAATTMVKT